MIHDCIIMAGGSGTRLWPASTSSRPKQFLSMPPVPGAAQFGSVSFSGSFFGAAVNRALAATKESGDGNIVIIAGQNHVKHIVEECAALSGKDRKRLVLIPEPVARNTAPAIACALLYIDWVSAGRERNIMVLTSDHIIHPIDKFLADAESACQSLLMDTGEHY